MMDSTDKQMITMCKNLEEKVNGLQTRMAKLEAALAFALKWGSAEYIRARTLWSRAVWRDNERPDQPMLDDFTVASVLCDESNSEYAAHELALLMNAERAERGE